MNKVMDRQDQLHLVIAALETILQGDDLSDAEQDFLIEALWRVRRVQNKAVYK